jgi:hypothetical protein
MSSDDSVQVWPVENGKILLTATTGIAFIELYTEGERVCRHFMEYINTESTSNGLPKQVTVTESELRQRVFGSDKEKKKQIKMSIFSGALGSFTVDSISSLKAKDSQVKLPKGLGFRGCKLGISQLPETQSEQLLLDCAFQYTKLLTSIRIYHDAKVHGLEFFYEDATSQLFGKREGKPDDFVLGKFQSDRFSCLFLSLMYICRHTTGRDTSRLLCPSRTLDRCYRDFDQLG